MINKIPRWKLTCTCVFLQKVLTLSKPQAQINMTPIKAKPQRLNFMGSRDMQFLNSLLSSQSQFIILVTNQSFIVQIIPKTPANKQQNWLLFILIPFQKQSMMKMKMGEKKLIVCTMGRGRQNCAVPMARPCSTIMKLRLKRLLKVTSYLKSIVISQYLAMQKFSTTEAIPLTNDVSMGLILLSLENRNPKVNKNCEEPKRIQDILSAPNLSARQGIIVGFRIQQSRFGLNFVRLSDINLIQIFFKMDIEKEPAPTPEAAPAKEEPLVHTLLLQIKDTLTQLDKAVNNKETRTISRITKNVRKYRNVIQGHHLNALFESIGFELPESIKRSPGYKSDFTEKLELNKNLSGRIAKTLQLEAFVKIFLVQIWWRDGNYGQCLKLVEDLLNRLTQANRRNLDNYTAVLYHYFARIHQKNNTDQTIREQLLEALNRACVRSDQIGQSTVFNLILRNYTKYNHLEAAFNLIEKCSFPESKSNNEFCKYLFSTGRIKAVRREYAQALEMLNQALRKSPDVAKGFKIQCQKVAIVVELLLGDIPNRQIFSDQFIFANLYPYFRLIQVVLEGELQNFNNVVEQYKDRFQKDGLYIIILRLNQIVIRIGLRRISLAYSNISLRDVASKLNIPAEDVEFVVAKALRDGIIHGEIDHQRQVLKVEKEQNIYVTHEPQLQLDKRIKYCLGLYHEIQKAITYPDMKMNLGESKEQELDASELMNLLDFDDDM